MRNAAQPMNITAVSGKFSGNEPPRPGHAAEPSGGKRETLLLKESGIELVPGRKYTPEQKSELERAIRRYDAVRARLNDGERRTADEYYRRLREILKQ